MIDKNIEVRSTSQKKGRNWEVQDCAVRYGGPDRAKDPGWPSRSTRIYIQDGVWFI